MYVSRKDQTDAQDECDYDDGDELMVRLAATELPDDVFNLWMSRSKRWAQLIARCWPHMMREDLVRSYAQAKKKMSKEQFGSSTNAHARRCSGTAAPAK